MERAEEGSRPGEGRRPRACARRVAGALALGALALTTSSASAQEFGYIDANGLPAAGPAQAFFAVPGPSSLEAGRFGAAFRSSVLALPLSAAQPSPSPEGTDTAVVSWLWLQELQLGVGLGHGIDVSLALPVHLLQAGQALTGVGVGDALAPIALGDLRLGVGAGFRAGSWTIGPRGVVYLPTGQEQEFAGERLPRGDVGIAASLDAGAWHFGGSVFARIRETSEIGHTRWGPQAALALGARYTWNSNWDAGLELLALPTLTAQPVPPSGTAGYLLPAEVLLGAHHRSEALVLGGFIGTGLPVSVASATGSPARGPTSPLLRLGVEIGTSF